MLIFLYVKIKLVLYMHNYFNILQVSLTPKSLALASCLMKRVHKNTNIVLLLLLLLLV